MLKHLTALLVSALIIAVPAMADQQQTADLLRAKLSAVLPNLKPDTIKPTPVAGIYEVAFGTQIIYMSKDGRYVFRGSLFDLKRHRDLSAHTRMRARVAALGKLDEDQMIVFSPKHPKYTVTVFTDIDCPYCRKLHSQMDQYLAQGIKVRYLMFPRSGPNTSSFAKAVSAWCAADSKAAITEAMRGKRLPKKTCDNPIHSQWELGQELGVSGTPAIVLDDGKMIPGYQPPEVLGATLASLDAQDHSNNVRQSKAGK